MDPAACRVIYIDDRFNTERWISREGTSPVAQRQPSQTDFAELPPDLQANVNAFLSVFNQVYVCRSGRSFSTKLSELHEEIKIDCTPIIACFDVGSEARHNHFSRPRPKFAPGVDSPIVSPGLRREITFSSESDESYGLQLLSRIASDLQVDESIKLIIPVAIVQPKRKDSYDQAMQQVDVPSINRAPYGNETLPVKVDDQSDIVDPQMMLQCLDAGALDVVRSPLDKAGIMGLTVHAYRIYKTAKNDQKGFMASARKRKQSWVGVDEEQPYAYLREAMVKKLLKGICEPQHIIEDYQHRDLHVDEARKSIVASAVGKWDFCGHDFVEDELVYAGYEILNHALQMPELEQWRMSKNELLRFMQGCQIAYNSFVLYHNFRHAVDVLQSLFYFLVQIGILPPYPQGSSPPPKANEKSPIAKLLAPFEALTLLISAIGHDVGHPGVNNMFLVKLNAPLAQLYNDQSVLEAFHCAAYSQILRRHWPVAFHDKALRKLMISSILATDMGVHSDYMQQMGNLQEKIHESKVTDGWSPKDMDNFKTLTCGLLIKCADISNVARPWAVAEKWTYLLQREFAHQGEMESAVGMETTLFGGPPELGNMLKLANGQIGFMTIFAHPLFSNVADLIPAMGFAAEEILTNKGVWFTRAEQEKKRKQLTVNQASFRDGGAISPRSQSPVRRKEQNFPTSSPLRAREDATVLDRGMISDSPQTFGNGTPQAPSTKSSLAEVAGIAVPQDSSSLNKPLKDRPTSRNASVDAGKLAVLLDNSQNAPESTSSQVRQASDGTYETEHKVAVFPHSEVNAAVTEAEMKDSRKDIGVSMRAGSEALPVPCGNPQTAQSELSKFKFATSYEDEPVRTFDPNQTYQPDHSQARASAPVNNLEHIQMKDNLIEDSRNLTSATSEPNTQGTSLAGGGQDELTNSLTPTHSTTATSYTSEQSMQNSPTPRMGDWNRHRAISAPLSGPAMNKGYNVNSDQSNEGSKHDVRTTVTPNGEVSEERGRTRKPSTKTLGRKSSRIKLRNLAFWKKRDKSTTRDGQSQPEAT